CPLGSVFPHDVPVTANHVVGDGPTKMIGARHGLGTTVASISFDSGLLIRRQRNSRLRAPYPTDAGRMPLFEIDSAGELVPFRRLRGGADLYERQIEDLACPARAASSSQGSGARR